MKIYFTNANLHGIIWYDLNGQKQEKKPYDLRIYGLLHRVLGLDWAYCITFNILKSMKYLFTFLTIYGDTKIL